MPTAECRACGGPVSVLYASEHKGLCACCWDDPLKRAAALFGEDDDPAEDRDELDDFVPRGHGAAGMTGMYGI